MLKAPLMITSAAIALPILLAVMGILMSLRPPATNGGRWSWGGSFLIVGLLAIIAGTIDRKHSDARQDQLQNDINGLRDAVQQLTKPLQPVVRAARDPDALYQNGNGVGKVTGARITLNESKVFFEQIENAGNLDTSKPFEYRDYVLRFIRADSHIGMLITPSGVATNVYRNVVCGIVGHVP
jgi:hypothetical protein